MIDPAALGTLRIGLDAIDAEARIRRAAPVGSPARGPLGPASGWHSPACSGMRPTCLSRGRSAIVRTRPDATRARGLALALPGLRWPVARFADRFDARPR